MSRPVAKLLAPLAALALALTACSSSGGSSGGDGPLEIAAIAALSGGVSANPEYGDGAQAAVQSINAHGGVNGRQLKLTTCDMHQNATDSANCVRKILSDKKIVALAGGSDIFLDADKAQLEAAKMPVVGQWPVSTFDVTNPLAFNVNGGTVVGFPGMAQDVVASGAKKVGLVTLDLPTSDVNRKAITQILSAAGVQVTADVRLSATAADLSAPVQQAIAGNPDTIIWLSFTAQTPVAVNALRQAGFKGTVAVAGVAFEKHAMETMGAGGPVTLSTVFPPAWDTSTAYGKQFNDDMKAYAPQGKITELALTSWLGVQMFAQVAGTLHTVDRAAVLDGLHKLTAVKTGGLTPAISFAAKSPLPYPGIYNPAYTVVHVADGTARWDGKLYDSGTRQVLQPAP
ncbi:ABC transporter substrate-binding protein [Nocardia sp. alder85J]|uniref:ABC transporter substrate-binding protein n=1 Tax=Nocardia sp. alder85J TaxID=2862949 RepID=UPI001CD546C3|nr:ABC transporter substrate-binding protein [Nocardia sp. alder85J]MCX4091893.1 ABC transporter substrate-binding protein [Nocardia sp. alder85J]